MTNLPKSLIKSLKKNLSSIHSNNELYKSPKDGTIKYLFELPDGMLIETVLMNQHYGLSVCERLKLVVISAVPSAHLD
jgi:23S rRNA (adenine2503-C2)-methyltransferase